MSKVIKYFGWISVLGIAGCGGNQPQPTMMGAGMDPLASNGSLGSGTSKGNVAKKQPDLGADASLNGYKIFDDGSFWNSDVEKTAVDPNSSKYIAAIGVDKPLIASFGSSGENKLPWGTPYTVVSSDAPRVTMNFAEAKGSDEGPYPFPLQMPLSKDSSAIVIDRDQQKLYEAAGAKVSGTGYDAKSGAIWDLRTYVARKPGQLAASTSGLPIFPGLVRFEDVSDPKGLNHALRFTVAKVSKNFVAPAIGSPGTTLEGDLPPMGLHLRLKKSFKINKFPTTVQPILTALKKYGMVLSDQGTDLGLSGTPDSKWIDSDLAGLKTIKASDFEAIVPPVTKGKKTSNASATVNGTTTPAVVAMPAKSGFLRVRRSL